MQLETACDATRRLPSRLPVGGGGAPQRRRRADPSGTSDRAPSWPVNKRLPTFPLGEPDRLLTAPDDDLERPRGQHTGTDASPRSPRAQPRRRARRRSGHRSGPCPGASRRDACHDTGLVAVARSEEVPNSSKASSRPASRGPVANEFNRRVLLQGEGDPRRPPRRNRPDRRQLVEAASATSCRDFSRDRAKRLGRDHTPVAESVGRSPSW